MLIQTHISLWLQSPDPKLADLVKEYKLDVFGCDEGRNVSSSDYCQIISDSPGSQNALLPLARPKKKVPKGAIESRYMQDPHVSFVVKAVSALTAAFRLVQIDECTRLYWGPFKRKVFMISFL